MATNRDERFGRNQPVDPGQVVGFEVYRVYKGKRGAMSAFPARKTDAARIRFDSVDDLYKAAKDMVAGWDDFMGHGADGDEGGHIDSAATQIPKLRAAIAKYERKSL